MEWIEADVTTTHEAVEAVTAVLMECGIGGVQIDDAQDMRGFLETNPFNWDYVDEALMNAEGDEVHVKFYVSANAFGNESLIMAETALKAAGAADTGLDFGSLALVKKNVDDATWLNEWRKYYKPFELGGRIVIVPVGTDISKSGTGGARIEADTPIDTTGKLVFRIEPGNVFGTGLHQTTQLCAIETEKCAAGKSILDLGCGSGILSIIGLLAGATDAVAVDIDPNAEAVVRTNASLNDIEPERLNVYTGNVLTDHDLAEIITRKNYDLVIANIVADIIIDLVDFVGAALKVGGLFICSGIISQRTDDVRAALEKGSFVIKDVINKDDWICIVCVRG